jgi:hypothetical protein
MIEKRVKQILAILLIIFIFSPVWSADQTPFAPLKTDTPPKIDGVLDDDVWKQAPSQTGFKTWMPDYDHALSEKTIVYYAYDSHNIYFAFRCFDRRPDQIKTSVTTRDNIRREDWVCVNLDSFNDHQSMYAFYANPHGIQEDSVFANGKEDISVDMVWYSAGKIDKEGYTIEMRIPFKSIRFTNGNRVEMGVIFERRVSRRSEQGTFPPLNSGQGKFFLTQTNPIVYKGVKKETLLELLPAVTASSRSSRLLTGGKMRRYQPELDLSLTGKVGLSSNLVLDVTVNPDFSHIEADADKVDLELYYALFYEEKRPFFLEGAEIFNIGAGNKYLQSAVHTRQIIDPLAGVRLTGKVGEKNTLAFMYALDDIMDGAIERLSGSEYAHFSILRYKRALKGDGYLGVLATGRDRAGGYNHVGGIDGQIRIDPSRIVNFHALGSDTKFDIWTNSNYYFDFDPVSSRQQDPEKYQGHSLGAKFLSTTRKLDLELNLLDISKRFYTDTGFLTRNGISTANVVFAPKIYPKSKILRRIDAGVSSSWSRDQYWDMNESENILFANFYLTKNSYVTLNYKFSNEIFKGERFDTGGFLGGLSTQISKHFFFQLSYRKTDGIRYISLPFQGQGTRIYASVLFQPSDNFRSSFAYTYSDFFRKSDGVKDFKQTIIRSKNTWQLNRYLFVRAIGEYYINRKQLHTDFLASFTYIPGTVVHVGYSSIYNRIRWANNRFVESDRFLETRRGFFFKVSYLWRL